MSVSGTTISIDANGSTLSSPIIVSVEHTDWSVEVINGIEWLTAFKNGDKIAITAKENNGTNDRTGSLKVIATANNSLSYSISVTQKGATPFITVNGSNSAEHTFPGDFGSGKSGIDYKYVIKVKSNVQWTISGKEDWLNVSPTSGNGDVDLTLYPTSENNSDKPRKVNLSITGPDINIPITIIQDNKYSECYVIPANEVALYNRFCWEYKATTNVNTFQYLLLSEREFNRLTDSELLNAVKKEEKMKYADDWISMFGKDSYNNNLEANSTYYFVSLACDKDDNFGALKKVKIKTPVYYDADQDAYVTISNFENNSYQFQFDVKKEGFCNTYHVIYGVYYEMMNSAVFAFEINYYLKNKKKHWLAKNDYYEWDIVTDYPNNHTFSYLSLFMSYYPICFGYGWGVFNDGTLSSDLLGFQRDTSTENARQMNNISTTETSNNITIKRNEYLSRIKSLNKK